jgi:LemA protein
MDFGFIILFGVLAVGAIAILFWGMTTYNACVTSQARYKNAFSQIDVQLKRRYDLIPNLVETAKAFMKHERETLEAVIAARNVAASALEMTSGKPDDPKAVQRLLAADAGLGGVMGRFFALSEAYPELKSNANMIQVSEELASTENRVAFARQAFNDAVTSYNVQVKQFPAALISGFCGFQAADLFELQAPQEREAPKVNYA